MLNLSVNVAEQQVVIGLEGRLDTITAPELDKKVKETEIGEKELVFDFEKLEYISSAGLRVLLTAQKTYGGNGMKVIHVNAAVMEIFDVTGFANILDIE